MTTTKELEWFQGVFLDIRYNVVFHWVRVTYRREYKSYFPYYLQQAA